MIATNSDINKSSNIVDDISVSTDAPFMRNMNASPKISSPEFVWF